MNSTANRRNEMFWLLIISMVLGVSMILLPTYTNVKILGAILAMVLVLWKTEIGLYGAVVALPFINFKYVAALMFYTFVCYIWKKVYKKEKIHTTPIDGPLVIFFIVLVFSVVFSITLNQSIKDMYFYSGILLMTFMVSRDLDKKNLKGILMVFAGVAAIVAIYGIFQYFTGEMGGHGWVDVKTNPNLKARAYSTMENPNILAEYLVIAGSISVALFLDSKNIWRKLLLVAITGIIFVGLLLTMSRGGWIAFAISCIIILTAEDKRVIPVMLLLGAVSIFFLPDVVIERLKTIGSVKDSSNAYRFLIWSASLGMLKDFWASGVGLGYAAFIKAYPNYMLPGIKAAHAHNSYLQMAIEIGVFGLLAFLWGVFKSYGTGIRVWLKAKDSFYKRIVVASMGAVSGLLFHSLVEHVLFDYRIIFSFWLMLAIIMGCSRCLRDENL
ncbi:O-antigen ligase [Proteiniborus ethanoligenes]|uniref:O-antigen ligase n=1 Tax=Proteiniborus ethanoligenes TaxID=415015 RepID=A0A1H3KQ76_9FIRM|nr:O-antigen ligase family protein [Proteiniborus ethanoligenes]TAH63797.1 MAG: hypothetical protein EWM50_01465 [Gottschalkiaceae bacterium]SDY54271.1 O-antigen ligase [Proteiniborus ethanoligenes]